MRVKDGGGNNTTRILGLESKQISFPPVGCNNSWQDTPARTTGSACCSWCSAGRWYSSASHSCLSPACRTASAAGERVSAIQRQALPPTHVSPAYQQMKPPQTLPTISVGSFNHIDDTNLEHGSPHTRARGGVGVSTQLKVIPLLLPSSGVWSFTGGFLWVHSEAIKGQNRPRGRGSGSRQP